MSQSNFRWRWGETNPVIVNVEADTVIHIGDLLWLDGHNSRPAPDVAGHADPSIYDCDMRYFLEHFLGVAMQASTVGSTAPIRVATSGTFQFDSVIAPSRHYLGTCVYPAFFDGKIQTQTVSDECHPEPCDGAPGIGRISHNHNVVVGSMYVAIRSAIFNC